VAVAAAGAVVAVAAAGAVVAVAAAGPVVAVSNGAVVGACVAVAGEVQAARANPAAPIAIVFNICRRFIVFFMFFLLL